VERSADADNAPLVVTCGRGNVARGMTVVETIGVDSIGADSPGFAHVLLPPSFTAALNIGES